MTTSNWRGGTMKLARETHGEGFGALSGAERESGKTR